MLVRCYQTWADPATQEQLWLTLRKQGWISAGAVQAVNRYYIPEHLTSWCLLIDPSLKHLPENDWYI